MHKYSLFPLNPIEHKRGMNFQFARQKIRRLAKKVARPYEKEFGNPAKKKLSPKHQISSN